MEFMNVKKFSECSKDLYDAMKAYSLNYNNERKGIKAFSEHSKEEMQKLINKAFAMEVAKQSGVALPVDMSDKTEIRRFANHPTVKYFANQIQDVMIDMILPETLLTGESLELDTTSTVELTVLEFLPSFSKVLEIDKV